MESFRNLIRGWLGKLLLILFLTPFALVGIEGYFSGGQQADAAKTVNGQVISKKELDNETQGLKNYYLKAAQVDESLLNLPFIENQALERLISQKLLAQQAAELGISLSDEQIMSKIAQVPEFQENGKFSPERLKQYLSSQGIQSAAWLEDLRQGNGVQLLSSGIISTALVSKLDTQQLVDLQAEKRSLFLSSIKLDADKSKIQVSEQEIANYYNKHPNQFKQLAKVDVDFVVVSPSMFDQTQTAVTDAELQQAYAQFVEKRKKDFQHEVKHILFEVNAKRTDAESKKLADEVYAKIKAGMSFGDAVNQYSDDATSKTKGGTVTYVAGTYGESFDQAVTASNGQPTQPIKTAAGYHIIESKPISEAIPTFEAERERLTAELAKTKQANYFMDQVNRLNESVMNNDALDVVSQEVKASKVETAKGLSLLSNHPLMADPAIKLKMFSEEVKNGERNAMPNMQLANGDAVWIKVRNYTAAGVQPLADAKARVKVLVTEQKALDAAKAKIANVLADFKTLPAQQVLAKHSLSFEDIGGFTRQQGLKREISRAAFSLPAPKAGMWSVTTAALPNELVIVAVADVSKSEADTLPVEQQQELAKLYQSQRGQQLLKNYTDYLESKAKVK
ncbi:peptidyl-prolyl cis-trans isomerase D [Acinetobacter calcoaceticus]|uniref:Periplasmic chaperone PpiD n=1 Tax=Acinetobacter calcoaceticus TaxID=471 RepID=A0A4V6NJD8_ACICA|nr:peptidyl-prolyl cis-trans isomerase D [Acinetobacter calcoaceticus]